MAASSGQASSDCLYDTKPCKRDRDCSPGFGCALGDPGEDPHCNGQGHEKHDHKHGGKKGRCLPSDIDDGNSCTADSIENGVVQHRPLPAGTSCEDGNACNGAEACDGQAQCRPGTPPALSDDNPCTIDGCDPQFGVSHVPAPAGTSCADQDVCDGSEICDAAGLCQADAPLDPNDDNPCTADSCDPALGIIHTPEPAGKSCADADQCNGAETCDGVGHCQASTPSQVDDGNPCTLDTCDAPGGVSHEPVPPGTSCDDGNLCNGVSTCDAGGTCTPGSAPVLDDGNPCTSDRCDVARGVLHEPVADGSACGDTNPCNGIEACASGECRISAPPATDDGNPCTFDSCDAESGIRHEPAPPGTPCGDADVCSGTERCDDAGACLPDEPPNLDDGNLCTTDSCSASGGISHTPVAAGTSCADGEPCNGDELCDAAGSCPAAASPVFDDGNPCTIDSCVPGVGASHEPAPNGTSCADQDPCDGQELCDGGGVCAAGTAPPLDDGNPCTTDSCDPARGIVHEPIPAGSLCADADVCNGAERCDADGTCQPSAPSQADDGNPCTIDVCDPVAGVSHPPAPAGTYCDEDADVCNGVSRCDGAGLCAPGVAPARDDQNPCTLDDCDPSQGMTHTPLPAGTSCADANACNGNEMCSGAGVCEPGIPPLIDDGNPCTIDSCDPQYGVLIVPVQPGESCSDGNPCNGLEVCGTGGACLHGDPAIDDQNPCTVDSCAPELGILHEPLPAGSSCGNDDVCDGAELCDASGECHPGTPLCDDGNACNGVEQCSPDGTCSDNPLALLTITTPAPASITRDTSVVVSGSTHSAVPVTLLIQPAGISVTFSGGAAPEPFSLPVPLAEGENRLTVDATADNQCSASQELVVLRDSIAPAVSLVAPDRLALGEAGQASVTATDTGGVVEVRLTLKLRGEVVLELSRATPPYSFDFSVPEGALAGDTLVLEVVAFDQAGNSGSASHTTTLTAAAIVVGRVLSDATGQPLGSASVRLADSISTTRPDGRYSFGARETEVLLRAFRQSFTSVERKAPVQFGVGSVVFDARLTPLAEPVLVSGSDATHSSALGSWDGQPITAAFSIPAAAFSGSVAVHVTPLSPQGLPGLLPPGFSPIAAFEARLAAPDPDAPQTDPDAGFPALQAPLTVELAGLPNLPLAFVAYDRSAHAWRALDAVDAGGGSVTRALGGLGAFALVLPDSGGPGLPVAGTLLSGGAAPAIPLDALAQGAGVPNALTAGGGIAQGRVVLSASPALASGAVVSAALTESYDLSSGLTASTETTLQDLVLYRAQPPTFPGAPSGSDLLGAVFPIATWFSFGISDLTAGKLHLDVLAGREAHRGKIGGHAPVLVEHAGASFAVAEGSLEADTLVDLERTEISDFVIRSAELVPIAQVAIDLSGSVLTLSGELRLSGLALPVEETPLLARLERVDGVAYPSVVALGNYDGEQWSFGTGDGFSGILKEGSYVVYQATLPLGFVAGTARAAGAPVQAVVTAAQVPFVAIAGLDGTFQLPVRPGTAALTAKIPGTNLIARGDVSVAVDDTTQLDLNLIGEVTSAVVFPSDGSVAVPRTTQITLASPVALDPTTVTEDNIRLFAGAPTDGILVDTRLQLSANARSIALIPELRLDEATTYTLQASGLRDTQSGLVVVPVTSFRTAVEVPEVVDTDPIEVTLPEDGGNAHVTAPPGSLAPGSNVLITNEGNGHVVSCSVGNSGGLDCEIPASINDTLVISITDPDGNTQTERRSQYQLPDGRTAVGRAGGTVTGPGGVELRIPEGALGSGVTFKLEPLPADAFDVLPQLEGLSFAAGLQVEASGETEFRRELDLVFPKPTDAGDDVFYYVFRQVDLGDGIFAYEAIDHAFVESNDGVSSVVTASCPFAGVQRIFSAISELAATTAERAATAAASKFVLLLGRQPPDQRKMGKATLISGRVTREKWQPGSTSPGLEPVKDATVSILDDSTGCPEAAQTGATATFAISQENGTFALWTRFDIEDGVRVAAYPPGIPPAVCCPEDQPRRHSSIVCSTLIEKDPTNPCSGHLSYPRHMEGTFVFPPEAPPEPPPEIAIDIKSDGVAVDEFAPKDSDIVVHMSVEEGSVISFEVSHDDEPLSPAPALVGSASPWRAAFRASELGTYVVTARGLTAFSQPLEASRIIQILEPGGGNKTNQSVAPRVLSNRTREWQGQKDVAIDVKPQPVFSEPVKGVPAGVVLAIRKDTVPVTKEIVPITLGGILLDGGIKNLAASDTGTRVTSVVVKPKSELKFATKYTLTLGTPIVDLDTSPKALRPAEFQFTTLQPDALTSPRTDFSSAGVSVVGSRAFLAANELYRARLRVFDISDAAAPLELTSLDAAVAGRPMDIDAERAGDGSAMVIMASGPPATASAPSNLHLFEVSESRVQRKAAVTVAATATEGIVRRVILRGDIAYALVTNKGVAVVDLAFARQLHSSIDAVLINRKLGTDGWGFGEEAVSNFVQVENADKRPAFLSDLDAFDDDRETGLAPVLVATGEIGLVTIDPAAATVLKSMDVLVSGSGSTKVKLRGRSVAVGRLGNRQVAAIAGTASSGNWLALVDISDPAAPVFLSQVKLVERPLDVTIAGTRVLIGNELAASGLTGTITVVHASDPEHPVLAGDVLNIAGRVATDSRGFLVASVPSPVEPQTVLGGINTASLSLEHEVECGADVDQDGIEDCIDGHENTWEPGAMGFASEVGRTTTEWSRSFSDAERSDFGKTTSGLIIDAKLHRQFPLYEADSYSDRTQPSNVDAVVMHHCAGWFNGCADTLKRGRGEASVSAHFLVGRSGRIISLVDPIKKANHGTYYNQRSIGIEMEGGCGAGTGGVPCDFPEVEHAAAGYLVALQYASIALDTLVPDFPPKQLADERIKLRNSLNEVVDACAPGDCKGNSFECGQTLSEDELFLLGAGLPCERSAPLGLNSSCQSPLVCDLGKCSWRELPVYRKLDLAGIVAHSWIQPSLPLPLSRRIDGDVYSCHAFATAKQMEDNTVPVTVTKTLAVDKFDPSETFRWDDFQVQVDQAYGDLAGDPPTIAVRDLDAPEGVEIEAHGGTTYGVVIPQCSAPTVDPPGAAYANGVIKLRGGERVKLTCPNGLPEDEWK
ncbi:MAG TPA: N-acetylmuramoyl-L-alanine amidase [Polyangiaceae bacterium]|nr:N-acetylmuramoyl-L-alanine amidase [Polyangiaceae bacterium]